MLEEKIYTDAEIKSIMEDTPVSEVPSVGAFRLRNQGGFIVKLQFSFFDQDMSKHHVNGSGNNITLGFSEKSKPGDHGVPDGSLTTVYAFVVWGHDNEAQSWFRYDKNSNRVANFVITGTTLNNQLGFIGFTEE